MSVYFSIKVLQVFDIDTQKLAQKNKICTSIDTQNLDFDM